MSRRLRRRYGRAASRRHLYEVHFEATHPSRPSLRTQAQTSVAASSSDEAVDSARASLALSGWIVGKPISVVKRFAIKPEHHMHGHARHPVQSFRAYDPTAAQRPTRLGISHEEFATVIESYPGLEDERRLARGRR